MHCKDDICPDRPRAPGVRGSAPVLRPMSNHAALRLPVSVGRPDLPSRRCQGRPAGPSAAALYAAGYNTDPTDGGCALHGHAYKNEG